MSQITFRSSSTVRIALFILSLLTVVEATGAETNYTVELGAKAEFGVFFATNTLGMAEALQSDAAQVGTVEIIAWAAKRDKLRVPPLLFQETVVLAEWAETSGPKRWSLACLDKGLNRASRSDWVLANWKPLAIMRDFKSRPTEQEVAEFLRASNFGHNECVSEFEVLKVIAYKESKPLIEVLQSGISKQEKAARYAAWDGYHTQYGRGH